MYHSLCIENDYETKSFFFIVTHTTQPFFFSRKIDKNQRKKNHKLQIISLTLIYRDLTNNGSLKNVNSDAVKAKSCSVHPSKPALVGVHCSVLTSTAGSGTHS